MNLPIRAMLKPRVVTGKERKSRARARPAEPGYLWVSAGRGLRASGRV